MDKYGRRADTPIWRGAQVAELDYWVRALRDELAITSRDQLVGFRLCQGRFGLGEFGLQAHDWMYSGDRPIISGRMLDVGSCLVSFFENCRSVSVVAIDPLLETLKQALPDLVVIGPVNNVEYRSCRIQDVRETDFDLVWCYNVLDHTEDWQDIVRHFARVLKPAGQLLLAVDVRTSPDSLDKAHISAFTAEDLIRELDKNRFGALWRSRPSTEAKYRFLVRARKLRAGEQPDALIDTRVPFPFVGSTEHAQILADKDRRIQELERELAAREAFIQRVITSLPYRAYRLLRRLLRRR